MKKNLHHFILMMLLLAAQSCFQQSSKVSLKLTSSFSFGGSNMAAHSQGGLMVWGLSSTGKRFGKVIEASDSIDINLPNESWTFYAMAWQNNLSDPNLRIMNATGANSNVRCAISGPIVLDGSSVSPRLELTHAQCDQPLFRGSASSINSALKFRVCENIANVDPTINRVVCSSDRSSTNYVSDSVPVRSIRVSLIEHAQDLGLSTPGRLSRCVPFSDSHESLTVNAPGTLVLPMGQGLPNSPFLTRVELYLDSNNCDDSVSSSLERKLVLPTFSGLANPQPNLSRYVPILGASNIFFQLSDQQLCQGRASLMPFAGGNGTSFFPFLICSEQQLYSFLDQTNLGHTYKLLSDVDLRSFGKNITDSFFMNYGFSTVDWGVGQNWSPVGLGSVSFQGSFDGNGHTITGLRMRMENTPYVGFISVWEPSVNGYVRDVHFSDAEIGALDHVAVVVGSKSSAAIGALSGIKVTDSLLEARSSTIAKSGAVIGYGEDVAIQDIIVDRTTIKAEGSIVGGIFGQLVDSPIARRLHSRAHVIPRYYGANGFDTVGGVGGDFSSSIIQTSPSLGVEQWSHEGIIISRGINIGGLLGQAGQMANGGTAINFQNFYAHSSITALSTSNANVGGIFGRSIFTGQMTNGYFSGKIKEYCSGGCNRGYIIGRQDGGSLAALSNVVALSDANFTSQGTLQASGNPTGPLHQSTQSSTLFSNLPFIRENGNLPRFISEHHPCAQIPTTGSSPRDSLAVQISGGRGTASNPLLICNPTQWSQVSSLTGPRHVEIATGIHLGEATSPLQVNIPPGVTVSGKNGFLFGYHFPSFTPLSENERRAPIGVNEGTLRDIRLSSIIINSHNGAANAHLAGFVGVNSATGVMNNIDLLDGFLWNIGSSPAVSAGLISQNNGTLLNSTFDGKIQSSQKIAGLVGTNAGVMSDTHFQGRITLGGGGITSQVAGIALINEVSGQISRVSVRESEIINPDQQADEVSFGLYRNFGLFRDFKVESSVRWKFLNTSSSPILATVAVQNNGTITRAFIEGSLQNAPGATAITKNNFTGQFIYTNNAPALTTGMLSSYPSGLVLASQSINGAIVCDGNDVVIPGIALLGSGYYAGGGSFWGSYSGLSDLLWMVSERNGELRTYRVSTVVSSGSPLKVSLAGGVCSELALASSSVSLIKSYQPASNISLLGPINATPWNGVIIPQNASSSDFVGPWLGQFYDPVSTPEDFNEMLRFYIAGLTGQQSPGSPRPWELSDDRMDLFRFRK